MKIIYSTLAAALLFSGCSFNSATPENSDSNITVDDNATEILIVVDENKTDENVSNEVIELGEIEVVATQKVDFSSVPREYLPVYFDFNSAEIRDDQKAKLRYDVDLASCDMAKKVIIVGYTDSVGGEVQNYNLGLKRAASVSSYMISNGVDEKKVEIKSAGKKFVKCDISDEECNAKNRKVEIYEVTKKHHP